MISEASPTRALAARIPLLARSSAFLSLTLAVAGAEAHAQTGWTSLPQAPNPGARAPGCGLTFDSGRDRIVLFGGWNLVNHLGDTWEMSSSGWTQRQPAAAPAARAWHALAYDSARARTVLFGGYDGALFLGDTWEWDGSNWLRRAIGASGPSRRNFHAMAFDSVRQVTVLFGGTDDVTQFDDTWEWNGSGWALVSLPSRPPGRSNSGLAFDAARNRMVLFGGWDGTNYRQDTWEWDGSPTGWMQRSPATRPRARRGHALSYDASRGRVVVFGGRISTSGWANDTWEWDGNNWQQRVTAPSPSARSVPASAYDSLRRRVVLFGGGVNSTHYSDTWAYAPMSPARFDPFGNGCAGNSGIPELASDPQAYPASLPWSGQSFQARLSNLGSSAQDVPAVFLGTSRTTWGNTSLPLDLGFAGMPGCSLFVEPAMAEVLGNNLGTATWSIAIPASPSLIGGVVFAQGFVLSPGTNAFGAVMSNACELVIGGL
jgi:hypothetical protein